RAVRRSSPKSHWTRGCANIGARQHWRTEVMADAGMLRFHVPEPEVRPGGTPDFSNVPIPKAGAVPRRDIDVDPRTIRDYAFSIIRVLNRNGEAVGPWAGLLSSDEL